MGEGSPCPPLDHPCSEALVLYVFKQGGQGTDWIEVVILAGLFVGVIYSMFVADELDRSASSVAAGGWPRWKRALRAARPRFARTSLYIIGGIADVASRSGSSERPVDPSLPRRFLGPERLNVRNRDVSGVRTRSLLGGSRGWEGRNKTTADETDSARRR